MNILEIAFLSMFEKDDTGFWITFKYFFKIICWSQANVVISWILITDNYFIQEFILFALKIKLSMSQDEKLYLMNIESEIKRNGNEYSGNCIFVNVWKRWYWILNNF